jgi:UDP-N-acetylglucosamine:LPS N-acetylglucosamine transferase
VICPCLDAGTALQKSRLKNIFLMPSFVRSEVMTKASSLKTGTLIMGSSSSVEANLQGTFSLNNIEALKAATAVVCNAGQSTLSECLYLGKKTLIAPLPGHAEQFANSRIAAKKGLRVFDPKSQALETALDFTEDAQTYDYAQSVALIRERLEEVFL